MGFSTAEGLPMATRSGSVDPGILIHLLREKAMSADDLERLLYEESGLQGMSGVAGGMRELELSTAPRARAAIEFFVYRVAREIAAMASALGGLDALVFTGGIGENSALTRRQICAACDWLGVELDAQANENADPTISAPESAVAVLVIATNEAAQIARLAMQLIGQTDEE